MIYNIIRNIIAPQRHIIMMKELFFPFSKGWQILNLRLTASFNFHSNCHTHI